jgi:hypothetical protein
LISVHIYRENGFPLSIDWGVEAQFNKGRSTLLGEPSDALITEYFDGGENITVKASGFTTWI